MESQFNYWEEKSPSKKPGESKAIHCNSPHYLDTPTRERVMFRSFFTMKNWSNLCLSWIWFLFCLQQQLKKKEKKEKNKHLVLVTVASTEKRGFS